MFVGVLFLFNYQFKYTVGANCVRPRETAGLPYEQNIPKQTNN